MKRKLSAGFILAAVLTLLAACALAAGHFGVLDFLFGGADEAAAPLVQPVMQETSAEGVRLQIDSAMTDGVYLAMDWTVENTSGAPVLTQLKRFTANGLELLSDGNDNFEDVILRAEGPRSSLQNGEYVPLPARVTGDELTIEMVVNVCRAAVPAAIQEYFDPEEAAKLMQQYELVLVADWGGFVVDDPEEGITVRIGAPDETDARFSQTEMAVTFTLDMAKGRSTCIPLEARDVYPFERFEARFTQACVSPLGLYLTLECTPTGSKTLEALDWELANAGYFSLADEAGNPLTHQASPDVCAREGNGGGVCFSYAWSKMRADDLPQRFCLRWESDDGATVRLFPLALPAKT